MESIRELKPKASPDTTSPHKVHFMQIDRRDRGLQKADDLWVNAGVLKLLPKLRLFTDVICLGNCLPQGLHDTNEPGTRCVHSRSLLHTPWFLHARWQAVPIVFQASKEHLCLKLRLLRSSNQKKRSTGNRIKKVRLRTLKLQIGGSGC